MRLHFLVIVERQAKRDVFVGSGRFDRLPPRPRRKRNQFERIYGAREVRVSGILFVLSSTRSHAVLRVEKSARTLLYEQVRVVSVSDRAKRLGVN